MSPTWLDNLERGLEERLEQFLRSNPSQDQLLREQHLQDRQRDLHNRRGQQQLQARELRRQLLTLAEQVQAWTTRGEKARRAGALELAKRADQHVAALMQQGLPDQLFSLPRTAVISVFGTRVRKSSQFLLSLLASAFHVVSMRRFAPSAHSETTSIVLIGGLMEIVCGAVPSNKVASTCQCPRRVAHFVGGCGT